MKHTHYIEEVYAITKLIPAGRVSTYGAIAEFLSLGSARMVGWALRQSVEGDDVPAHRVVNRKGELSGRIFFATPTQMQERLEAEGVRVEDHKVLEFDRFFWSPMEYTL